VTVVKCADSKHCNKYQSEVLLLKIAVFWHVVLCYQGWCVLMYQRNLLSPLCTLMTKAANSSETLVSI